MGHTVKNGRYRRTAVRPSWNDDRYLLGYLNSITGEYVSEPALDFIIQAEQDREHLYFFCLDEMNLAHVEYYFSQFLSALEEEETADRRIPLYSQSLAKRWPAREKEVGYEQEIIIPPNLLFTGTINVDETTQPLSDKVIDRANTLEFFAVDLEKVPPRRPTPEVMTLPPRCGSGIAPSNQTPLTGRRWWRWARFSTKWGWGCRIAFCANLRRSCQQPQFAASRCRLRLAGKAAHPAPRARDADRSAKHCVN